MGFHFLNFPRFFGMSWSRTPGQTDHLTGFFSLDKDGRLQQGLFGMLNLFVSTIKKAHHSLNHRMSPLEHLTHFGGFGDFRCSGKDIFDFMAQQRKRMDFICSWSPNVGWRKNPRWSTVCCHTSPSLRSRCPVGALGMVSGKFHPRNNGDLDLANKNGWFVDNKKRRIHGSWLIKGSLGGETSVLRTFRMSGK